MEVLLRKIKDLQIQKSIFRIANERITSIIQRLTDSGTSS